MACRKQRDQSATWHWSQNKRETTFHLPSCAGDSALGGFHSGLTELMLGF